MLRVLATVALALPLFACVTTPPPETPPIELIVLEHAAAEEVADVLRDVFARSDGPFVWAVADARTNSLIFHGDPAYLPRVKELIAQLDREVH